MNKLLSNKIDERNTWVYYVTQLFYSLIFTIPIWIVYYQSRITIAEISALVTIEYVSQMVLELPSGALADMIGRKKTNILGFTVGAIAYLIFPFAITFGHFVVLALMMGLMSSFRSGSEEALLYDTFKQSGDEKKFGPVYANGNIIYQAGLIIATAMGGLLFSYNESLPYFLHGFSLAIGVFFAFRYIEPTVDSEKFTLKNYLSQMIVGAKEITKDTYTKYLSLFSVFVGGIAWSSTLYFNAFMMVELGFGDSMRGFLVAGMRLINVVVIAAVLKNTKIFNWKITVLFFPIMMMFGYLPAVFVNGFLGLPFVQAAMIVTTARWIILAPLTNEAFSSKYRATAISVLSLLIGVVYITLTSLSGFIIPEYGVKVMYSLLGVVTLFTVLPISIKLLKIRKS